MDEYLATAAVGEVGDAQYGMKILSDYTAGDNRMHMCYSFEFLSGDAPSAKYIYDVLSKFMLEAPDSWSCWAFSNHDVIRHATRWADNHPNKDAYLRLMTTFLLTLRGSVCLYQGEELGLPEADVGFDDLQDPYGIQFWPTFKGRDGCRTPIPWEMDAPNAGFSDAKPWLPVADSHHALSVDQQIRNSHSIYTFYQQILLFRRKYPVLAKGHLSELSCDGHTLSFIRHDENEALLCVFNISNDSVEVPVSYEGAAMLGSSLINGRLVEDKLHLDAWSASIISLPQFNNSL